VFSVAYFTRANEFLAAFCAGFTLSITSKELKDAFERFGSLLTELLKFGGVFLFGIAVSNVLLSDFLDRVSFCRPGPSCDSPGGDLHSAARFIFEYR
jgi:hypothetical protein